MRDLILHVAVVTVVTVAGFVNHKPGVFTRPAVVTGGQNKGCSRHDFPKASGQDGAGRRLDTVDDAEHVVDTAAVTGNLNTDCQFAVALHFVQSFLNQVKGAFINLVVEIDYSLLEVDVVVEKIGEMRVVSALGATRPSALQRLAQLGAGQAPLRLLAAFGLRV